MIVDVVEFLAAWIFRRESRQVRGNGRLTRDTTLGVFARTICSWPPRFALADKKEVPHELLRTKKKCRTIEA